jgi:hypothetical protein
MVRQSAEENWSILYSKLGMLLQNPVGVEKVTEISG